MTTIWRWFAVIWALTAIMGALPIIDHRENTELWIVSIMCFMLGVVNLIFFGHVVGVLKKKGLWIDEAFGGPRTKSEIGQ